MEKRLVAAHHLESSNFASKTIRFKPHDEGQPTSEFKYNTPSFTEQLKRKIQEQEARRKHQIQKSIRMEKRTQPRMVEIPDTSAFFAPSNSTRETKFPKDSALGVDLCSKPVSFLDPNGANLERDCLNNSMTTSKRQYKAVRWFPPGLSFDALKRALSPKEIPNSENTIYSEKRRSLTKLKNNTSSFSSKVVRDVHAK